ncbi:hypothetical protein [Micromonospora sp. NBC_01813]|uniref:hypothetical protein n=1 Tax=Micromonospora sp. NBC_01813 TaxID=2975988 RepID=UPI002DD965DF|nr:hypothetical protein [Micromonospora sp. NBC_01813]WSA06977.1 hypothetical protein OG958_22290 [Micromonospora sp. NBC_01813]
MNGITQAVDDLAAEIGATVNWTALHRHLHTPPVAALITAAATAAHADSLIRAHQQDLNDILDTAHGHGGLTDDTQLFTTALATISLTLHDQRQTAIDQARTLAAPLAELGVLAMHTPPR